MAEDGMAVIEVGRRDFGDEELASSTIWTVAIGHAEHARSVVAKLFGEFVGDRIARPRAPMACAVAGLNEKTGHDAVEDNTIIEGDACYGLADRGVYEGFEASGQADEIGDRDGSVFGKELTFDDALSGMNRGHQRSASLDIVGVPCNG